MIVYTAPSVPSFYQTRDMLFLAGGISGCGDWHADAINALSDLNLTIFNPRRPGTIDRKDKVVSELQIKWERTHLMASTHILFWFPNTSVCPIALFELGGALERKVGCGVGSPRHKVYVGCEPDYDRIVDLEIQLPLIGKQFDRTISIHSTLTALLADVRKDLTAPPIKIIPDNDPKSPWRDAGKLT